MYLLHHLLQEGGWENGGSAGENKGMKYAMGFPSPYVTHQHDAAVGTQDLGALLHVLGELLVAEGVRVEEKGE